MKGYWLILGTAVTDPEIQAEYGRLWGPIGEKYGARVIREPKALELIEKRPDTARLLIVEFPSYAAARACYEDADYQAAKILANRASVRDLVVFEGDLG